MYVYVYVHIPTLSSPSSSLSPYPSLSHHQPPKTSRVLYKPVYQGYFLRVLVGALALFLSLSLSLSFAHILHSASSSHTILATISLSPSPKGREGSPSSHPPPSPSLNRVVSRTLGATFRPSLSKQDPLETETENSLVYLLFLALFLFFSLS